MDSTWTDQPGNNGQPNGQHPDKHPGIPEDLGVQRIGRQDRQDPHRSDASGHHRPGDGEKGQLIEGDLCRDCTGIRSLLLSDNSGAEYEDQPLVALRHRAVAVQTASVGEPVFYTRSIAHPLGWQWRILLQHRVGNGIVFSSNIAPETPRPHLLANVQGDVL